MKQRDRHAQQSERLGVIARPSHEGEHLDLGFELTAVVGQDVHPVVLREQRGSGRRPAWRSATWGAMKRGSSRDSGSGRPDDSSDSRASSPTRAICGWQRMVNPRTDESVGRGVGRKLADLVSAYRANESPPSSCFIPRTDYRRVLSGEG